MRIALLLHGSESSDRGGPSIRAKLLRDYLCCRKMFAEIITELNSHNIDEFDIIHVFNIWPLETSLSSIYYAHRHNKKIVFSPIVLQSHYWLIYDKLFSRILPYLDCGDVFTYFGIVNKYIINKLEKIQSIQNYYETLSLCCQLSDHVIFLSNTEKELIEQIVGKVNNFDIVINAVDDQQLIKGMNNSFKKQFNLDKYILCVGRIEYRKNQLLLAALSNYLDYKIVLIGGIGSKKYYNQVLKVGGKNLKVLPHITDRRLLASAYYNATCFVLPSWSEGAPLSAIEAGILGTPLILSSESSEQEYFKSFADYVKPYDHNGLRKSLETIISHPESSGNKTKRSDYCRQKFSFENHGTAMVEIYKNIMSANKHNRAVSTKSFPCYYLNMKSSSCIILQILVRLRFFRFIPDEVLKLILKNILTSVKLYSHPHCINMDVLSVQDRN